MWHSMNGMWRLLHFRLAIRSLSLALPSTNSGRCLPCSTKLIPRPSRITKKILSGGSPVASLTTRSRPAESARFCSSVRPYRISHEIIGMFVFLSGTIENYWNVWRVAGKTALGLTFARRFIRSSIEYWSRSATNSMMSFRSQSDYEGGLGNPLAIKDLPSLGPDGDAGAEFARISCREDFVRVDLDFAQQRLRVARPDTRWLELRRSDRIVQKCRSDQIFQIVVRLLFGLRSILGTEGAATGDVEAGLKDITQDAFDVVCRQAVVAFELENGLQHWLTVDE